MSRFNRGAKSSAPFDSMIVIFPRDWKEVLSGNKRGLSVLERNSPRGLFPNGARRKMDASVEKGFHSDGNRRDPPLEVVVKKEED